MKEGPLVQMLDRQRVRQAAADEAKKLVDAAAAIFQHDHVLLNLTSIILSMAKNHDSLASFPALCLAAQPPLLRYCQ
jgi:hypothetical protein